MKFYCAGCFEQEDWCQCAKEKERGITVINWNSQAEYNEHVGRAKDLLDSDSITLTAAQLRKIYELAPEQGDGSGGSLEQAIVEAFGWKTGV